MDVQTDVARTQASEPAHRAATVPIRIRAMRPALSAPSPVLPARKPAMIRRLSLPASAAFALALLTTPAAATAAGTGAPPIYAQHLVDKTLKAQPGVLIMALHVTPPGKSGNVIIASNIGRIGKPADADDLAVIRSGQPNLEVNKAGSRFEVEMPLQDMVKDTIGALSVVFPYHAGADKGALEQRAFAIRDQLRRHILTLKNLFDPFPFVADAPPADTLAQKLVDETLAAHPHLLVIGMHVTPPGGRQNVIVASNFGRIGKPGDSDDMGVVTSGKPKLEINADGKRFEVELWLLDRSGASVGAISFVFPYTRGESQQALLKRAEALRDALRPRITSVAALMTRD